MTPFLFIGFDAIPQLIKDMAVSRKTASAMAVTSLVIGMCFYVIFNFLTALSYSPTQASQLDWALGSGVMSHLGRFGFVLLVIALASAVSAGINGFMICASKLISAMAGEGIVPSFLGHHNRQGSAITALILVTGFGILSCFFGREVVIWIVDMCSFGAAVTYFYVCMTTLVKGKGRWNRINGLFGMLFAILFGIFLLCPASPAYLSLMERIILGIWSLLGLLLWLGLFYKDCKFHKV